MTAPDLIFFVHIMKVGGTSLNWMIRRLIPRDLSYPDAEGNARYRPYVSVPDLRALTPERRQRIRYLTGHFPYCVGELFQRPIRHIVFVRDPTERVLSFLRAVNTQLPETERQSLEALYDDEERVQRFLRNLQTRVFAWNLDEEMDTVFDPRPLDRADLERAKSRLERCEVIGLQEDYVRGFELVKQHFGFRFEGLPKANVSVACQASRNLHTRINADNELDLELYHHARMLYQHRLEQSRQ